MITHLVAKHESSEVKMYGMTVIAIFIIFLIESGEGFNKYAAEANINPDVMKEPSINFRNLEKPFRMAKINVLWSKAQLVRGNIIIYIIYVRCTFDEIGGTYLYSFMACVNYTESNP